VTLTGKELGGLGDERTRWRGFEVQKKAAATKRRQGEVVEPISNVQYERIEVGWVTNVRDRGVRSQKKPQPPNDAQVRL
jgi:hypothetical protein